MMATSYFFAGRRLVTPGLVAQVYVQGMLSRTLSVPPTETPPQTITTRTFFGAIADDSGTLITDDSGTVIVSD